ALAITLLDVLSGFENVRICTGYRVDGEPLKSFTTDVRVLEKAEPAYEDLPGWSEDISGAKALSDLPANCRAYVERVEALAGAKAEIISVGPERAQTIWRV